MIAKGFISFQVVSISPSTWIDVKTQESINDSKMPRASHDADTAKGDVDVDVDAEDLGAVRAAMTERHRREAKAELESITRRLVDAVNRRDLDDPVWENVPQFFKRGHHEESFYYGTKYYNDISGTSLRDTVKALFAYFPAFHMTIQSVSSEVKSEVFARAGYGEVFVNSDFHGYAPGLVQPVVSRFEYRITKGRWRMVRHENLKGLTE